MADDRDQWERIRGRDASAFEAFYRDNAGRLCAYLPQIVGNAQAEDMMQETFTICVCADGADLTSSVYWTVLESSKRDPPMVCI